MWDFSRQGKEAINLEFKPKKSILHYLLVVYKTRNIGLELFFHML